MLESSGLLEWELSSLDSSSLELLSVDMEWELCNPEKKFSLKIFSHDATASVSAIIASKLNSTIKNFFSLFHKELLVY